MEGLNLFALSLCDMGKFHHITRGLRRLFHVSLRFAAMDCAYGSDLQELFENRSHLSGFGRRNRPYTWSVNGLYMVFYMV